MLSKSVKLHWPGGMCQVIKNVYGILSLSDVDYNGLTSIEFILTRVVAAESRNRSLVGRPIQDRGLING